MKPNTGITCTWGASTAGSGSLSGYEIRYTADNGSSYTTVSTNIGVNTRTYSFTPQARDGQQVIVQVRAKNSYGKYSSWGNFPAITIYTDGMSVGKVNSTIKHLRAYVKVAGQMKKINYIKVKVGGVMRNIDQYPPPLN